MVMHVGGVEFKVNTQVFFQSMMALLNRADSHFVETGNIDDALESEAFKGLHDLALSPAPESGDAAYQIALICRAANEGRPIPQAVAKEICPDITGSTELWFQCAIDHGHVEACVDFANFIQHNKLDRAYALYMWAAERGSWRGMDRIVRDGLRGYGPIADNDTQILVWARRLNESNAPQETKDALINTISSAFERDRNAGRAHDFVRAAITMPYVAPRHSVEEPELTAEDVGLFAAGTTSVDP